jgi:hypothetical protein
VDLQPLRPAEEREVCQRARLLRQPEDLLEPSSALLGLLTQERLRAGLRAYMQFMASEPEFARMCITEVLAAGPRALTRRNEAMRMFAEIIEDNIHELIPGCPRATLAAETIVGGIHEVVFNRILTDRIDELPGLADDLLVTILMLDIGNRKLPHDSRPPLAHPPATQG